VTGLGVVSSIGIGRESFFSSLAAGRSGISEISSFDTREYPTHRGGEVKDFNPDDFIFRKKAQSLGRASQLAIAAAALALKDAALAPEAVDKYNTGVSLGTTMGESQVLERLNDAWVRKGPEYVDAAFIPRYPACVIPANVAEEFGLRGPNYVIPTACAAGNYSIGYACDLIRKGAARAMLAGGTDAFSRIAFMGFNRLLAVAPQLCQPFDRERKGMMVGEGAGILFLELYEDAIKRKADIYAEILGYGLSCDAHHMTAPHAPGIAMAMTNTLKECRLSPEDIDYICAHGTGTPANDKEECLAIKQVFKERSRSLPVSSIKSMLGHTMGAASGLGAIACCLALKHAFLPPTINFRTPDPDCEVDCVPNLSRKAGLRTVLNNSSAFGGNNACLALRAFNPS
jgi:3-oxoacyl-[acyl-carrier-protein] synthase II